MAIGGAEFSPLKTGLKHAGLSLLLFGGLAGALGAGIHVTGDPDAASPMAQIALFDRPDSTQSNFKTRLTSDISAAAREQSFAERVESARRPEGDLGLDYSNTTYTDGEVPVQIVEKAAPQQEEGIRINGRWVRPGQSLSEVTASEGGSQGKISIVAPQAAPNVAAASNPITIKVDDARPAQTFARAFSNPSNKPTVSLIVGGLGINASHTRSAIDELPADVTLSFAPDARRVQYWMDEARKAGHEVMLEIPMEAYEYGRMKMHPLTLTQTASNNSERLSKMLGRAKGYFGVINHQGAKFATDDENLRPILDVLKSRGIALIEDNALTSSKIGSVAKEASLSYAAASEQIDANQTTEDITAQLMELETQARENGQALGTGVAYPLTIEIAKSWTAELKSKGILLAPASAHTKSNKSTIKTGSTPQTPLKNRG